MVGQTVNIDMLKDGEGFSDAISKESQAGARSPLLVNYPRTIIDPQCVLRTLLAKPRRSKQHISPGRTKNKKVEAS